MGNLKSRQSDLSPLRKCLKTEHSIDVNNCSCIESHQTCISTNQICLPRWEGLPYVALLEVYQCLSNNDKASMGLTCKAWLLPFTRPALWRRGYFRFDGEGDRRAMQFVALMGSALRHVDVDCSVPKEKVTNRAKVSAVNFCLFLSSLITADNRKLSTVCVRNLGRLFRYWVHQTRDGDDDNNMNPLRLLIAILGKQEKVQVFDVANAGFLADQAIRLLESLRQPSHVKELVIADIVAQIQRFDLARHPRFLPIMSSFTALTYLHLSEEYISHELLMTLSSTVPLTLRRLGVKAFYNLRRHPSEDLEESWEMFCNLMTDLEISFGVKGVFAGRDIARIIPRTLRLSRLEWDLGNSVMDFKSFYLHLVKFKTSLQYLTLTAFIGIDSDVEYLYHIVQRLPNLHSLVIESLMIPAPILYQLEWSLRRCFNRKPPEERVLKEVIINGRPLETTESWYSYFAGLLVQHI